MPETDDRDLKKYPEDVHTGRADLGKLVAEVLRTTFSPEMLSKFKGGFFLGLGAGTAAPELALTEALQINPAQVFLVDKKKPAAFYLDSNQGPHYIEKGIFTYLQDKPDQKYGLVTLCNLEFLFRDEASFFELLKLLRPWLIEGGVVVAVPLEQSVTQSHLDLGYKMALPTGKTTKVLIYNSK